ncbi:hypothetical protein N619_19455 [Ectopseudomonas oleovorans]|nr:hypothetical protein N619_19455 [Pseudomonas oleovorans]
MLTHGLTRRFQRLLTFADHGSGLRLAPGQTPEMLQHGLADGHAVIASRCQRHLVDECRRQAIETLEQRQVQVGHTDDQIRLESGDSLQIGLLCAAQRHAALEQVVADTDVTAIVGQVGHADRLDSQRYQQLGTQLIEADDPLRRVSNAGRLPGQQLCIGRPGALSQTDQQQAIDKTHRHRTSSFCH